MNKFNYIGIVTSRQRKDRIHSQIIVKGQIVQGPLRLPEDEILCAKDYDLLRIKYNREPKNGFYTKIK